MTLITDRRYIPAANATEYAAAAELVLPQSLLYKDSTRNRAKGQYVEIAGRNTKGENTGGKHLAV